MAVQQNRKTRAKRDQRRSHDRVSTPTLTEDQYTGEIHRRHHVASDGRYRGRQVREIEIPEEEPEED